MWYDWGKRQPRRDTDRSPLRCHVTIQGYEDGAWLDTEFDIKSTTHELQHIAEEKLASGLPDDAWGRRALWQSSERRTP